MARLILMICIAMSTGCIDPQPMRRWEMKVTSPTGDVVKTRVVRSRLKPRIDYDGEIMLDHRSREYIPHGWYAEFRELGDE